MRVKGIEQGSPEWLAFRNVHIGGSDIASILGISPWKNIRKLWEEKKSGTDKTIVSAAMKYGSDMESSIRDQYIENTGIPFTPQIHTYDEWDIASASLDGIDFDNTKIIEIKCPKKSTVEMAKNDQIPNYYLCQMQWSMMCTNTKVCDYICYDKGDEDIIIVEVRADKEYQATLLEHAKAFWKSLEQSECPFKAEAEIVDNDSFEFTELANQYISAHKKEADFKKFKEEIKEKLVSLAGGISTRGAGLKVCLLKGRSKVDNAKLFKDFEITEEVIASYTTFSKPFWQINLDTRSP